MKPIALAIALLFAAPAFAQTAAAPAAKKEVAVAAAAASAAPTSAPVSANPVPGGADVAPVVSKKPGVFPREINPFTGKPLSGEELQARLEASKLLTQQLEEQLKQVTLAGEIEGVPARKGAENATAKAEQRKEEIKLAELEAEAKAKADARAAEAKAKADAERAAKAAARAAAKEDARRKKAGLPSLAEEAAARAAEAAANAARSQEVMHAPVLVSVQKSGTKASAMFDHGGATLLIGDGEASPFGVVKVLDEQSVEINGKRLQVNNHTISRFAVPENVDRKAAAGAAAVPARAVATGPSTAPVLTVQQMAGGDDVRVRVEGAGTAARLPPLQVPPGVQVIPSNAR